MKEGPRSSKPDHVNSQGVKWWKDRSATAYAKSKCQCQGDPGCPHHKAGVKRGRTDSMTTAQLRALGKVTSEWKSAYELHETLGTLIALKRIGLVEFRKCLGHVWTPRTSMLFRLKQTPVPPVPAPGNPSRPRPSA
mgnify:CR=1 FL=1